MFPSLQMKYQRSEGHSTAPIPFPSSCKGTIDDIYLKLRKIQLDKQGGTVTLQRAIEQV